MHTWAQHHPAVLTSITENWKLMIQQNAILISFSLIVIFFVRTKEGKYNRVFENVNWWEMFRNIH